MLVMCTCSVQVVLITSKSHFTSVLHHINFSRCICLKELTNSPKTTPTHTNHNACTCTYNVRYVHVKATYSMGALFNCFSIYNLSYTSSKAKNRQITQTQNCYKNIIWLHKNKNGLQFPSVISYENSRCCSGSLCDFSPLCRPPLPKRKNTCHSQSTPQGKCKHLFQ